ncbi:glutathione S-transferase-like protein [Alteromonadaceae bacterium 2753L.S.0a.02]|nr:glutathione S-transferase-like protein [Alteromonadaceae bacterium 2753L.S.0a.02]
MSNLFQNLTTQSVTLYYSPTCGYCYRVLNAIEAMNLKIATENIRFNNEARVELYKGGGKTQVPALRIKDAEGKIHWMYESLDIIEFLETQFTSPTA